jgi:ParB-like chromosome segregation protein Spo0J
MKNNKLENKNGSIWPEITVSVDDLKPMERNPRKITNTNYKKLKESLKGDGLHNRIKATRDLRIIGGHQRIKALKELGYTQIPILVPPEGMELTDDQFREQVVKDNLHYGEFDYGLLLEDNSHQELIDWGINASLLQVAVEKRDTPPEAEEVPELGEKAISKLGDIGSLAIIESCAVTALLKAR